MRTRSLLITAAVMVGFAMGVHAALPEDWSCPLAAILDLEIN